jgi:hypothetical protein
MLLDRLVSADLLYRDAAIFALGPGEIGAAAETPAGLRRVTVPDVQEARHGDLADAAARKPTRRERLDGKPGGYLVGLRKKKFPVEVYFKVYNFVVIKLARQ